MLADCAPVAKKRSRALLDELEQGTAQAEREALELKLARAEDEVRRERSRLKSLRKRYDSLRSQIGMAESAGPPEVRTIKPRRDGAKSTAATVFLIASDWHVEEEVNPDAVNHLNEYDPAISANRAAEFFRAGHRLIDIVSRDVKVETIVLALLGDFITNHLHDENPETNSRLPTEAIQMAQGYIASGIRFLLENTDDRIKLFIPCHSGNHGRTTRRVHAATEHGHSLEWLMYRNLEMFFAGEKRVEFHVAESYHSYVDCYGTVVRFHHGHAINYRGGIGGIYVPVHRQIGRWNRSRWADLDVFGHFHQMKDGGSFVSNGSLIGYNAYALGQGYEFEPPRQTLFVIDSKRGRTITAPIIVEPKQ